MSMIISFRGIKPKQQASITRNWQPVKWPDGDTAILIAYYFSSRTGFGRGRDTVQEERIAPAGPFAGAILRTLPALMMSFGKS